MHIKPSTALENDAETSALYTTVYPVRHLIILKSFLCLPKFQWAGGLLSLHVVLLIISDPVDFPGSIYMDFATRNVSWSCVHPLVNDPLPSLLVRSLAHRFVLASAPPSETEETPHIYCCPDRILSRRLSGAHA
jgi:hypothetical protein